MKRLVVAFLVVTAVALAACSSDDSAEEDPEPTQAAEASVAATEDAAPAAPSGGETGNSGSATLTIGDETWEFDSFSCAFGHDATQSDVYAFVSDSRGVHSTGARVQMQASIRDETGGGRFEGSDVIYEIDINDIDDFTNPSVQWSTSSSDGFFGGGEAVIRIDGDDLTAEGLFVNGLLDDPSAEKVPGTLEATCGSQSRR